MLKRTKNSVVKMQEVKSRAWNHHTHLMRWRNKERKKKTENTEFSRVVFGIACSHYTHYNFERTVFVFQSIYRCVCVCVSALAWVYSPIELMLADSLRGWNADEAIHIRGVYRWSVGRRSVGTRQQFRVSFLIIYPKSFPCIIVWLGDVRRWLVATITNEC